MKRFFSSTVMVTWMSVSALSTGCTTVTVKEAIPLPEVPEYVKVPHPAGYDSADLKSFLLDPLAPKSVLGEFADTCDEEYTKLLNLNASKDELKKGAEELVTRTPERLHWCFYSKLGRLQDQVNGDAPWSVKQKSVIAAYSFLSPIANAFLAVYQDSRYLKWATQYYAKMSEWVFFKTVVPNSENKLVTLEQPKSDLEPWIVPKTNFAQKPTDSVFEKYGIALTPEATPDTPKTEVAKKPEEQAGAEQRTPASANPDLPPLAPEPK